MLKTYFYKLLYRYLAIQILPEDTVVEILPSTDLLIREFPKGSVFFPSHNIPSCFSQSSKVDILDDMASLNHDYILINGQFHYERDIQAFLHALHAHCSAKTRVIITYYNNLWKPLMKLATWLGIRSKQPEKNWIAHEDIRNMLLLEDFEPISLKSCVLFPVWIPLLSAFFNRYIAPLPLFRHLTLINILIARPLIHQAPERERTPSVSVIVPARNEAGNIEQIVKRLPSLGPDDELIFVEGHSRDHTWETIQRVASEYGKTRRILTIQQDGVGKGDAVRKGFQIATNEILMILDADLSVPPETLPRFYDAIVSGKGEFINGSRLVYPMEKQAMRFFNLLGNKFFALAFSFVIGQRFKDTLCGTKVLSRSHYEKLAQHRSYFGDFDPFGDFDLIFGAARLGLKIVEIPITYHERTYGTTNISRWRHGILLLKMLIFAARKLKFV